MPALDLVLPGDPGTRTGGYEYDRRIAAGLRALGWEVAVHALDASFPDPTAAALEDARDRLAHIPDRRTVLVDGLALGAMPEIAEVAARRLRLVALVHHPLALETGLAAERADELRRSEARALAAAACVIATSAATASALAAYGVERARIVVVEPGTDPAPLARGSGGPGVELLCVATLVPRKGHALLVDALAGLADRDWHLTCAGSRTLSSATSDALVHQVGTLGLADRVTLAGELDRTALAACYDRADVFVLPTFHEGYGMALAEALARGLPIVSTTAGAVPDTVPGDAGLLVAPGDLGGLRAALASVLDDAARREQLARGARGARALLPTWAQASARLADALTRREPAGPPQGRRPEHATREGSSSSAFTADWLDLREPADTAARAARLVSPFVGRTSRIVDLGTGTGANLRYLAPRLGGAQDWLAVDRDPVLLGALAARPLPAAVRLRTLALDLDRSLDALPLEGCDLVTASALLDLVSAGWLERLVAACAAARAGVLFALTYDGRIECSPVDATDARVRELLNLHQRGDKGFGAALGPVAGATAARRFVQLGYAVDQARSDWVLGAESSTLQAALVDGWLGAALALAPGERIALEGWAARRRTHIAEGVSRLRVGHIDIAGTPPDA